MMEIAENEKLSDDDKTVLISYAQRKFINRRRIAYAALYAIITSLALLFTAAFIDGLRTCPAGQTCKTMMASVKEAETLIIRIEGFLTAIVAAYFGLSGWRPAS